VARLDCDQPAGPAAEYKDRPEAQRTAAGEQNDAQPAQRIPIEDPDPLSVQIGRKISQQQADQREGGDDSTVGTVFAFPGAQVAFAEDRYPGQHEQYDGEGGPGRVGEKGGQSAPTEDGEPQIGEGRRNGEDR